MAQVFQGRFRLQNVQVFKTQCLGQGSYGTVYHAQCDLLPCVAKLFHASLFDADKKSPGARAAVLEKFERECDLLCEIHHPNIVQCIGTHRDKVTGLPVLFVEHMQENLTSFLQRNKSPTATTTTTPLHLQVDICYDVVLALAHLHSNGIVHRNLSSNNILLCPCHRAKVADCGMSKLVSSTANQVSSQTASSGARVSVYMPPEALQESAEVCSEKVDCFSAGVIAVQVMTGLFPEPGPRTQRVKRYRGMVEVPVSEINRRKLHIDLISNTHPLLPIAIECLKNEATERLSSHDMCSRLASLKEHAEYQKSVQSPENQVDRLHTKVQNREEKNARQPTVSVERKTSDIKIDDKDQKNGERQQTMEEVEDELQRKDEALEALSCEVVEKSIALEEREAQLERVKKDRLELSVSLQHLQKEMAGLRKKNERLEREVALKEREIQRLQMHGSNGETKNGSHSATNMTWKKAADAPFAGKFGAATALGDLLCIRVAGSSEIHVCDAASREWFQAPPCPLDACSLVAVNNTLTVVGGRVNASVTNLLYSVHLKSFQAVKKQPWREQFPPMPTKRMFAMATSSANVLAVAGGWNGHQALRTVEILRLDHEPMHWIKVSSLPSPVYSASACICRGKLYILGGFTQKGPTKAVLSASVHSLLDLTKDSVWHRPTSLPTYRSTCIAIEDHLLSFGGENDNESQHASSGNDNTLETGAVFEYSSTEAEWCMVSEMPVPRCQSCVAAIGERREIIVVGGHSASAGRTHTVQIAALEV